MDSLRERMGKVERELRGSAAILMDRALKGVGGDVALGSSWAYKRSADMIAAALAQPQAEKEQG